MRKTASPIETGTIIARWGVGPAEQITATVTMSAADWDNLTAGYAGFGFRAEAMPLDQRISHYLAIQVSCWKSLNQDDEDTARLFDADLDDDVPF